MPLTGASSAAATLVLPRRTLLAAAPALAVPRSAERALLVAADLGGITTLDPHLAFDRMSCELVANMYRTLVAVRSVVPLEFAPCAADLPSFSAKGRILTFRLRPGNKFGSGEPVTAMDVVASFVRCITLNAQPAAVLLPLGWTPDTVAQLVRAPNSHTLELETAQPLARHVLLGCLSSTAASIASAAALRNALPSGLSGSAGSGPFRLGSLTAGGIVLEAVAKGSLQRVEFTHEPDPSMRVLAVRQGRVHVARGLLGVHLRGIAEKAALKTRRRNAATLTYLGMNAATPALKNSLVRQAIRCAIDPARVRLALPAGSFSDHQGFVPPGLGGTVTEPAAAADPGKARQLLRLAGYTDGLTLTMHHAPASRRNGAADAIAACMEVAGIHLTPIACRADEVLSHVWNRDYQLALLRCGADYPDPHSFANAFCGAAGPDVPAAKTCAWTTAWTELAAGVGAAALEPSDARRWKAYETLQRELSRDGPFAILFSEEEDYAADRRVVGLFHGPVPGRVDYARVTLA